MAVVPNALLIIDGNFLKHVFHPVPPDVSKLTEFIKTQAPEGEEFVFQSFFMDAPVPEPKKSALKKLGIQVPDLKTKTMDVRCSSCGHTEVRPIQADVDIEIATTLLEYGILPSIRYIVLVSGDGDFSRVVTKVVSAPGAKKLFILFGRLGMTSKDLVAVAGPNFIDLEKKNSELGFMGEVKMKPDSKFSKYSDKPKEDVSFTKVGDKKKGKVRKEKPKKDVSGYFVKDGVVSRVSDEDTGESNDLENPTVTRKSKSPRAPVQVKDGVVVKVIDGSAVKAESKVSVEKDEKDLVLTAEEKAFLEADAPKKEISVIVVLPSLKKYKLKLKESMTLWDVNVLLGKTYPELEKTPFLFGNDSVLFTDTDYDLTVEHCLTDNQTIRVKKMD